MPRGKKTRRKQRLRKDRHKNANGSESGKPHVWPRNARKHRSEPRRKRLWSASKRPGAGSGTTATVGLRWINTWMTIS